MTTTRVERVTADKTMPRRCSVSGCRSNYDGEENYVNVFSLPKNEDERSAWLRKIPTDFSKIKNPVICLKHFPENCIIWKDKVLVNGEMKEFPRKIPKLQEGTLPTIFPNLPAYLSSPPPSVCRLATREEENYAKAIELSLQDYKEFQERNSCIFLAQLMVLIEKKQTAKQMEDWAVFNKTEKIVMCFMELSTSSPCLSGSIVVKKNLEFDVYINEVKVHPKKIPGCASKLTCSSALDNLILYVENQLRPPESSSVDAAIALLEKSPSYEESRPLQFFVEQLQLMTMPKNTRRYSNLSMIMSASMYVHSPSAYCSLRKLDLLMLPHPRNLRKLICNFDMNDINLSNSVRYLESKLKYLKEHELIVNIMLDEIYLQPNLTFKGGSLYGSNTFNATEAAKTAQVFMISSVFSKYKDVVSIIPVNKMTAQQLHRLMLESIKQLEKLGFKVLSLISDNNSVNRRAYELFTETKTLQPFLMHPLDPNRLLFFIFDVVHILKCLRNNWISDTRNGILKFPCFE